MSDGFDSLFSKSEEGDVTPEIENTVTEEIVEEAAPVVEETVEEVTAPEPVVEQVKEPVEDRQNWVPPTALQQERQRRQDAERRAAEHEQKLREIEAQRERANAPDPFVNPDEYSTYLMAQAERMAEQKAQQIIAQREQAELQNKFSRAAQQHSPEEVQTALDYARARSAVDDAWGRNGLAQEDPVAWFLAQRNEHVQFEEYMRDPSGFKARIAAEMGTAGVTPVASAQTNTAAAAPKSLANTGSNTAKSAPSKDAFDRLFKK
jgi:hypothetical protein